MRVPDNLDIFEMHEREQERLDRLRKRVQREYEKEEYGWQHYTNSQDNSENYSN